MKSMKLNMTTEQKAKAYDEAKYIMKKYIESGNAGVVAENTIRKAFPELRESDDESIRKDIVTYLKSILSNKKYGDKFIESWIARLEAQGEQKPADTYCQEHCKGYQETGKCFADGECKAKREAEQKTPWSKEDERTIKRIDSLLHAINESEFEDIHNWLKFLKDRVIPQPKREWSEEDEEIVEALNDYIKDLDLLFSKIKIGDKDILSKEFREKVQLWLKSLRPQSTWKPSEEQLKSLKEVIDVGHFTSYPNAIEILYEQLKKLREE